jgi:DNA repair ATPase RecN
MTIVCSKCKKDALVERSGELILNGTTKKKGIYHICNQCGNWEDVIKLDQASQQTIQNAQTELRNSLNIMAAYEKDLERLHNELDQKNKELEDLKNVLSKHQNQISTLGQSKPAA